VAATPATVFTDALPKIDCFSHVAFVRARRPGTPVLVAFVNVVGYPQTDADGPADDP
jgi:hypothetical protein